METCGETLAKGVTEPKWTKEGILRVTVPMPWDARLEFTASVQESHQNEEQVTVRGVFLAVVSPLPVRFPKLGQHVSHNKPSRCDSDKNSCTMGCNSAFFLPLFSPVLELQINKPRRLSWLLFPRSSVCPGSYPPESSATELKSCLQLIFVLCTSTVTHWDRKPQNGTQWAMTEYILGII